MAPLAANPSTPVSSALEAVKRLGHVLASVRTPQIQSTEVRGHLKAVALAWFESYRPAVVAAAPTTDLVPVDSDFRMLLTASEKSPSTVKIRKVVKALRAKLVPLQTTVASAVPGPQISTEGPPSFAAIPDPLMQQVLTRRWQECVTCLNAGAPLAATVMMGGLLESLFLARINRESNKQAIFTAKSAPKDGKSQQPLSLKEWTLRDYIAIAHELGWIPQAVKDVSEIVRDYRNYIHPQKELSHQVNLTVADARMFWGVSKAIATALV